MDEIARHLPGLAWERLSAGEGSKGERLYDWTMIVGWQQGGWMHGLLVRRSIEQEPEHAYDWFHAPVAKASLETLVLVFNELRIKVNSFIESSPIASCNHCRRCRNPVNHSSLQYKLNILLGPVSWCGGYRFVE